MLKSALGIAVGATTAWFFTRQYYRDAIHRATDAANPTRETNPAFGSNAAQTLFTERNTEFVVGLGHIRAACDAADIVGSMSRNDIASYCLVRLVIEDFNEIVQLCANGSTTGGMKILRGMFERTVTACYMDKHPEEVEAFIEYFPVSRYKAAMRVKQDLPGVLPDEMLQGHRSGL
jgi:hypothetical protein